MSTGATPSRDLKELGVTALLGMDRAARQGESPATLLTRAAIAGARARAGRCCRVVGDAVGTCPADTRSAATASQTAMLERLLASPDAPLIHEWCTLARERGVRVPEIIVPVLLEWWARQPTRRPEVFEVTGACGTWLAALNPTWRKPVAGSEIPADADEVWQTGSSAERAALLFAVRKEDPDRAMAMVRATWRADGAEERHKFVGILGHGVTGADEPFLESALDDRSKAVRREAAVALTRLVGSALRARMRERAGSMLIVTKTKAGLLRRGTLTITIEPPGAFDKAWERDGIDERPAAGTGKRAFWMAQVLAATDLAAMTQLTGLAPSGVLAALHGDEFFDDAFGAMLASLAACPGQPDSRAWGDALVSACGERGFTEVDRLRPVWASQAHDVSEALRLRFFAAGGNRAREATGTVAWRLLTSDPRAWSSDFTLHALAILRDVTPKSLGGWEFWSLIESASKLLHPGAAQSFVGLIGEMYPEGPSESVRRSLDRVLLRAEMHREFQS